LQEKLPNTVKNLSSLQPTQGFTQALNRQGGSSSNNFDTEVPIFIKERLDLKLGTRFNLAAESLARFQFFNFLAVLALTYSFDIINKDLQKTLL
jgi:hypothetical protein